MSVTNSLNGNQETALSITYKAGDADVTLSPTMVKKYLVSGDAKDVTTQEIVMFMNLCKYQGLNPFLREAYLVKYGSSPATIVTGKAALEKRAARCERYKGFEAGIIVLKKDGTLEYRTGTFWMHGEQLVGGWAKVYVEGFAHPVEAAVSLQEYNTGKSVWAQKPATMIRKVAKVHALREAFPEDLSGLYVQEESGMDVPESPVDYVETGAAPVQEETDEFADIMGG